VGYVVGMGGSSSAGDHSVCGCGTGLLALLLVQAVCGPLPPPASEEVDKSSL